MSNNKNKGLIVIAICVTVVLAGLFAVYFFRQAVKTEKLPVLGQVSAFTLRDSAGQKFDSSRLRGKVWVANFFCTNCSDMTTEISKNMASLSRTFDQVPAVQLVSFTVNPEQDTTQILHTFAKKFKKGKDNWHFLTGERDDIRRLSIDDFRLGNVDSRVWHSAQFPLVDRSGHIRGYYDGSKTADVNRLFIDANVLLKERF